MAGREPWPLTAMPDVPTRSLLCRDDRLSPEDFMRRITSERLGITADEIDGPTPSWTVNIWSRSRPNQADLKVRV
jgi:hypothetical protein